MRLVAAKSHPSAARTIGIAPELQTALAFGVSGAFAAMAGVGLAAMAGYISPEPFSLTFAINIIAAAVLGGIGSIPGAIVGGAFLAISPSIAASTGIPLPIFQGAILSGWEMPIAEFYGYSLAGLLISIGLLVAGIRMPDKALRLAGPTFLKHFDLKAESAKVRESYGGEFGQRCLVGHASGSTPSTPARSAMIRSSSRRTSSSRSSARSGIP